MQQSPQLKAVYQRAMQLQQQANDLPELHQALLFQSLEELQAVLEELQVSEEELRHQNEALVSTRHAVEAERQRYQELFEFAPDGYLVTDADGRIQEANCAIATLLNISQPFLVGKPLLIFVDPPERPTFHLTLDRLQQVNILQDWEIHLRSHQRSPFDAMLTVSAVRNARGQLVSLRWLLRDITKQKQTEGLLEQLNSELEIQVEERTAQLRQALSFEAGLKRIIDKVRDSLNERQILQAVVQELTLALDLVCCDTALYNVGLTIATVRYTFTNERFANQEGEGAAHSPAALGQVIAMATLPEIYRQLLQGKDFQFCDLECAIDGNLECAIECDLECDIECDTHSRVDLSSPCHLATFACPVADEQGVLGNLRLFKLPQDAFSELEIRLVQQVATQCAIAIRQAQLYQATQAQLQEMKKLDQLKDTFLSTTSHELRSPMSNMRMAIRMLKIAVTQERAAAELLRPEPVKPEPAKPEPIKPEPGLNQASAVDRYLQILDAECNREINLINDLLDFQRLEAGEHSLVMQPICLSDWLPQVIDPFRHRASDRQQVLQLDLPHTLPVLVSDAATLERIVAELCSNACKYTPPSGQITFTVQAQPTLMQLIISNPSSAISVDELAHIFDKFYRIPNSDPWKQGGTGLGLALVQKLTEQLGGTIAVKSALGQLCFTVELPFLELACVDLSLAERNRLNLV